MKHKTWALLVLSLLLPSIAMAEVVVIASKSMPDLSKSQVKNLFLGKLGNVDGVGKVSVLYLDASDPARKVFNKKILRKKEKQLKSYWTKMMFTGEGETPESVGGSSDMVNMVGGASNIIGYTDSSAVNDSVKVLYKVN